MTYRAVGTRAFNKIEVGDSPCVGPVQEQSTVYEAEKVSFSYGEFPKITNVRKVFFYIPTKEICKE